MKHHSSVITKHFDFVVIHSTSNGISHSKALVFLNEVSLAIAECNDCLREKLQAIEVKYREELDRVGK